MDILRGLDGADLISIFIICMAISCIITRLRRYTSNSETVKRIMTKNPYQKRGSPWTKLY